LKNKAIIFLKSLTNWAIGPVSLSFCLWFVLEKSLWSCSWGMDNFNY